MMTLTDNHVNARIKSIYRPGESNTRVLFSSVNPSETIKATFEDVIADGQKFMNISTSTTYWVSKPINASSGTKMLRMNNTYNPSGTAPGVGPSKSVDVVPGDVLELKVRAYYEGASGFGANGQTTAAVAAAITQIFTGTMTPADAAKVTTGVNSALGTWGLGGNRGDALPSAYLNYILFDKNYKPVNMGYTPVPSTANGSTVLMTLSPPAIKEPGYMFVYLSYESDGGNWVYFDDFEIVHTKSNVLQYNEYYPFGLSTASSWTREGSNNNYLYNAASELNKTTGWYEMQYRNYDPVLGRMLAIDPLAPNFSSVSTYNYGFNSPSMWNDPTGAYGEYLRSWDAYNAWELQNAYQAIGMGNAYQDYADREMSWNLFTLKSRARDGDVAALREYNRLTNNGSILTTCVLRAVRAYSEDTSFRNGQTLEIRRGHKIKYSVVATSTVGGDPCPPGVDCEYARVAANGGLKAANSYTSAVEAGFTIFDNGYDHFRYRTTGGKLRPMLRSDGSFRSPRAAQFYSLSRSIKAGGLGLSFVNLGLGAYLMSKDIKSGKPIDPMELTQLTVGTVGFISSGLGYLGIGGATTATIASSAGTLGLVFTIPVLWHQVYKGAYEMEYQTTEYYPSDAEIFGGN